MLVPVAVHAGQHKWIAGDALEARECYILQAPKTTMWNHRHFKKAGAWNVPRGNIFCVREVDRSQEQLWYRVEVKKMATLDRSQHIPGWIDSTAITDYGVMLAY